MKKYVFLMIVCISLFFVISCKDDESCDDPFSTSSLTLNTAVNETIEAYGTKFYTFEATTAGDYTISLTNLGSTCGWELWAYISECGDDYIASGETDIASSSISGSGDKIDTASLATGTYLVVVDEWSDIDSSYTLEVQF